MQNVTQCHNNASVILGASQSAHVELPRADRIVCMIVRSDTGAFLPCIVTIYNWN